MNFFLPFTICFQYHTSSWKKRSIDIEAISRKALEMTARILHSHQKNLPLGELGIIYADDVFQKLLNQKWRGKNKSTNVLTFPAQFEHLSNENIIKNMPLTVKNTMPIGDIILAYETILKESLNKKERSFESHVSHLIIHGFLHLCNYNHIHPLEARIMEDLETEIMIALGYQNPYM